MSWLHKDHLNRWPVITDRGGVQAEWTFTPPKTWDRFWDNIKDTTSGLDIVVTDQNGETVLAYDLVGFVHATQTVTIRWNLNIAAGSGAHEAAWIYWNRTAPPSQVGAPTTVAPSTPLLSLTDPTTSEYVISMSSELPGSGQPSDQIAVTSSEQFMVWMKIPSSVLPARLDRSAKSDRLYEVEKFSFKLTIAGVDQMLDVAANARMIEDSSGDTWLGGFASGLTDGVDYTGVFQVNFAGGTEPTLNRFKHFLIKCNNTSEAP